MRPGELAVALEKYEQAVDSAMTEFTVAYGPESGIKSAEEYARALEKSLSAAHPEVSFSAVSEGGRAMDSTGHATIRIRFETK